MTTIPMQYETTYRWTGNGEAGTVDIEGHATLPVGSPLGGDRYSPEHMLVATVETCLANYVLVIASMSKLAIEAYQSNAEGELEKDEGGYRFKRFLIRPQVTVAEADRERAQRVLEKAHKACLVARSLNCPVEIQPRIVSA
jgi:organic hydroperoxide reductase OsmC/OhrA